MQLRDLIGRPVFDVTEAREVTGVRTAVVDPASRRVVAFRVGADEPVLGLDDVKSIGADSVTVDERTCLRQPSTEPEVRSVEHGLDPLGSRVLTDEGTELGRLEDLEFDETSGEVVALVVGHERVAGERLLGIGTYAVVVEGGD